MDKYYHFTSYNCFYSIMENGLVPQTGFRCQSIGDDKHGVFLSKGIDNSIIMYSLMLSFYEKYVGYEGDKIILEDQIMIQNLMRNLSRNSNGITKPSDIEKIKCYYSEIERVNLIRSCGSFINYLGGYGCFLSVDDLNEINDTNPEDCCYSGVIPPSKINVVNVMDKNTNQYINRISIVLSYFMCLFPLEEILKNVQDNKNSIRTLYKYRDDAKLSYYNPNNFELVEIPIMHYNPNNQNESKIKILTR